MKNRKRIKIFWPWLSEFALDFRLTCNFTKNLSLSKSILFNENEKDEKTEGKTAGKT